MRRRGVLLIGFLAMSAVVGSAWLCREQISGLWRGAVTAVPVGGPPRPRPDPQTYSVLSAETERWRVDLAKRYAKAKTPLERELVEQDARLVLEETLPAMMRCWLGTPWDFHGTAEGPGKGKIACGYFVATVLKDAGFRVDRYRLAQQPSENILRTFLAKDACSLTIGKEYEAFATSLGDVTPGIYVIGLDTHVAFLVVRQDGFRFIHSSGSRPWCVVDEGRNEAEVLKRSNWRMLGNFTGDAGVLRSWLKGEKIAVKGA
jgi:hypothetical protein